MCNDGKCQTTIPQTTERRRRNVQITRPRIAEIRQAAAAAPGGISRDIDEILWLADQGRGMWCRGCGGFHPSNR